MIVWAMLILMTTGIALEDTFMPDLWDMSLRYKHCNGDINCTAVII